MSFKNILIKKEKVKIDNNTEITIRALNTTDIVAIISEYEDLAAIILNGVDFTDKNKSIKQILVRAPALAYMAIALSADDPEAIDTIAHLPLPVQIELFQKLYSLTFPKGAQDIKKIRAALKLLLQN